MTVTPALEDLGLQAEVEDTLSSAHAQRVARTLDLGDDIVGGGTLPLTWIWTFFTPMVPTSGLRPDGHPAGQDGSPLTALDRRMFVGASLHRRGDLRLDARTQRTSRVVGAQNKEGSTGPFLLVDIEHHYRQDGDLVLVEQQRLLYRTSPTEPVPAPAAPVKAPVSIGARQQTRPDERLLFRYSALTFNSHRIHYDLPYATQVEGYPGLVVHGPLTATLLAHLAEHQIGARLTSFSFRATAPTFAGTELWLLCDAPAEERQPVRAVRQDGVTVMKADAS